MSKRKTDHLFEEIKQMATRLGEGDESLSGDELRDHLRETATDPDELTARFHDMAKRLAERERLANRPVPLTLKQAIDATRPGDEMPSNPASARAFGDQWLDKFRSAISLPKNLESVRAYRKSGDVSESDQNGLDELEQKLKDNVKREHDGEA